MNSSDIYEPDVRLLGGEMLTWTDYGRSDSVFVGQVLHHFVCQQVGPESRVLILGPHSLGLIGAVLGQGAEVETVVRSYPDAREAVSQFAEHPRLTVYCGGFDRFTVDNRYDVVAALGGLELMDTPDADYPGWGTLFRTIVRDCLLPGGVFLLGMENQIGIHRIVEVEEPRQIRDEGSWRSAYFEDVSRPSTIRGLVEEFRAASVKVEAQYGAYPDPMRPTVAVERGAYAATNMRKVLETCLRSALLKGFAGEPVLRDPSVLAEVSLHCDLGLELAPLWVVRGVKDGEEAVESSEDGPPVRRLLAGEDHVIPYWSLSYEVKDVGGSWQRALVPGQRPETLRAIGRVRRMPAKLESAIPYGMLLEEVLFRACAEEATTELRHMIGGYIEWLLEFYQTSGAGKGHVVVDGPAVFASLDNVVVRDGLYYVSDTSWAYAGTVNADVVLVYHLGRFAEQLLSGAFRHPWPMSMNVNGLTRTLLAIGGHAVAEECFLGAARLQAEIVASREGLSSAQEAALINKIELESSRPSRAPALEVRGYREAVTAVRRLREELDIAKAQIMWLDDRLVYRERQLRKVRGSMEMLRNSTSFKFGRRLTAPGRGLLGKLMRTAYENRPDIERT